MTMEKLSFNRDLADYVQVIDELLMNYVTTDVFAEGSEEERGKIVYSCCELKEHIGDLIKEKAAPLMI